MSGSRGPDSSGVGPWVEMRYPNHYPKRSRIGGDGVDTTDALYAQNPALERGSIGNGVQEVERSNRSAPTTLLTMNRPPEATPRAVEFADVSPSVSRSRAWQAWLREPCARWRGAFG